MDFVTILTIFVLACFVCYLVWSVTPALHTPLILMTGAISSMITVGAQTQDGEVLNGRLNG